VKIRKIRSHTLAFRTRDLFAITLFLLLSATTHAQLPDPGMQIDPQRPTVKANKNPTGPTGE
jgi:hypothetical protein